MWKKGREGGGSNGAGFDEKERSVTEQRVGLLESGRKGTKMAVQGDPGSVAGVANKVCGSVAVSGVQIGGLSCLGEQDGHGKEGGCWGLWLWGFGGAIGNGVGTLGGVLWEQRRIEDSWAGGISL